MKYQIVSLVIVLIATIAALHKFELVNINAENSINFIKNLFNLAENCKPEKLTIWTAATVKGYNESVYDVIRNVSMTLNHTVIKESNENGTWNILWSNEYVYDRFPNSIRFMKLKPNQLINHFPGLTFLTNKLHLAVSTTQRFIPSSFNFPSLKNEFLYYAKIFPDYKFVIKNMDRGGIEIVPFERINFSMGSWSFLQLFIESLLIEGHAFDIGVYVLLTSADPLRIYKWDHDITIRFCSEKYEPFDIDVKEKYVCSLNYKNLWEIKAFEKLAKEGKQTNKEILNNYLKFKGHNTSKLWDDIDFAINTIIAEKTKVGLRFMKIFTERSNNTLTQMFELLRFDFVVDKELIPHLMEANMSPEMNLTDDEFSAKNLMNIQVIRDTLRIVGAESLHELEGNSSIAFKTPQNIAVNIEECSKCDDLCESPSCELCIPCLTEIFRDSLYKSYMEHQKRGEFRRIFPKENSMEVDVMKDITEMSKKSIKWFEAKCTMDDEWC